MMTQIIKRLHRCVGPTDLSWVIVLGIVLIAGCATVPPEKFPYATVTMHNSPYFALVKMCEAEGIVWDYDPLSKVIILKKENRQVKLLVGSAAVMADDAMSSLSAPVELKESVIYAPLDLRNLFVRPPCPLPVKAAPLAPVYLRRVGTVALDAGHGGKDPGAVGRRGLKEKGVVLDVVLKMKEELERCGLKVYLTRPSDDFIQLQERPRLANEKQADIFVSVHANANRSRWVEGFEVYYLTEGVDDNARALAAAENASANIEEQGTSAPSASLKAVLWDMIFTENRKESIELAQFIGSAVSKKMNLKMLGVKGAPFAVLKGAEAPAVLVEIGYLSNGEGEKKLSSIEYRQKMAQAIAEGILKFKSYSEGTWINQ